MTLPRTAPLCDESEDNHWCLYTPIPSSKIPLQESFDKQLLFKEITDEPIFNGLASIAEIGCHSRSTMCKMMLLQGLYTKLTEDTQWWDSILPLSYLELSTNTRLRKVPVPNSSFLTSANALHTLHQFAHTIGGNPNLVHLLEAEYEPLRLQALQDTPNHMINTVQVTRTIPLGMQASIGTTNFLPNPQLSNVSLGYQKVWFQRDKHPLCPPFVTLASPAQIQEL